MTVSTCFNRVSSRTFLELVQLLQYERHTSHTITDLTEMSSSLKSYRGFVDCSNYSINYSM